VKEQRNLIDAPADVLQHLDSIFYGDPKAANKALGVA
jgi:hypothetical protein